MNSMLYTCGEMATASEHLRNVSCYLSWCYEQSVVIFWISTTGWEVVKCREVRICMGADGVAMLSAG